MFTGTAAVANITTVPKGKVAAPMIRAASVSHTTPVQPSTTSVCTTTQG